MKCPGCNFVCSELRDICPKCVSDLRPFKVSNGLPVTYPAATFEELVGRLRGKTSTAKPGTSSSSSLLGGVLSVIAQVVSRGQVDVDLKKEPLTSEPSKDLLLQKENTQSEARIDSQTTEESSETRILYTEDLFPSCASAAGPHSQVFEWVVPSAPREEESKLPLEGSPSSQLQEDEATNLHTVSSEIEVEPPTTHSSVFNSSTEGQSILPDSPSEYPIPQVIPTEIPPEIDEFETQIEIQTNSESAPEYEAPHSLIESPPTYSEVLDLTPLSWNGDTDSVEEAFGAAFSDIRSLTASSTIHTGHLFQHSTIDSEQILLHFSLALDELEGRLKAEKVTDISTSDSRHVETAVIDSALQEVQNFLNKADQPAPLKEFIQETLAEHNSHHYVSSKKDYVGFSPRILAIAVDVATTFFTCLLLTSLLERGGLAEILADLSVNGFRTRHYHWLVASLALVPLTFIFYHFLTLPFLHATIGERITGLSIRSRNGRPIKAKHITFRALSAPLATLIGGPLFMLLGRPALLDYLSGTEMHHFKSET